MPIIKLTKYINLALNNSSEGEASSAARMFFKKMESLDLRFNPKTFNLTRSEAIKLADLAGKVFKGLNDVQTLEEPTNAAGKAVVKGKRGPRESYTIGDIVLNSKREVCYFYFDLVQMESSKQRKAVIDGLVENYGFDKRSVQSYASNYRAGKWR